MYIVVTRALRQTCNDGGQLERAEWVLEAPGLWSWAASCGVPRLERQGLAGFLPARPSKSRPQWLSVADIHVIPKPAGG